jgi:hypothetical protein
LSFFFKIILFKFFIGLLTLILLLVLDDYFLDFFFVTHDGFQFDIKDRLVDYLQSVNNESTNEVTKNVSDGVGKDVKDVIVEKKVEEETCLDLIKDFYSKGCPPGHPVQHVHIVSVLVAVNCITFIIILKYFGFW